MNEATSVVILSTLVQTTVITLTLLVFIFQFRSQEQAIKESSYQNIDSTLWEPLFFIAMLITAPLDQIYSYPM